MRKSKENIAKLTHTTSLKVRFSEVDSLHIVWHGEYVKYMEDGREAFGLKYGGIGYMDIYENGYLAPMVDVKIQYKRSLRCNDIATVEVRYIDTDAAKICFEYIIRNAANGEIVATGSSVQVFLDSNQELQLLSPKFYLDWKKRWGVR